MIDQLKKLIAPLQRRIFMMVARGMIQSTDDTPSIQQLQVTLLTDEVIDKLQRIQEYGFTSSPLPGAEVVTLFMAGNRDHGVVIATDDRRYRKKNLANGEVALYTDQGDYIHFKRGGTLEILTSTKVKVTAPNVEIIASTKVTITSPNVEISGDLDVEGNINTDGNLVAGGGATITGAVAAASVAASGAVTAAGVGIAAIKTAFNSHTHVEAAVPGPTATPLPVIP